MKIPDVDWIFFDLDGTLWDHSTASRRAIMHLCERYGLPPMNLLPLFKSTNEFLWGEMAEGRVDFETLRVRRFEMILDQLAAGCCAIDAQEVSHYYIEKYLAEPSLFPGTLETIEVAARHARLAVLTNAPRETQQAKLAQFGRAAERFSFMQCGNDGFGYKPALSYYEAAVARAGGPAPERVLMIGDAWREDVEVPRSLGWRTVWISHGQDCPEEPPGEVLIISEIGDLPPPLQGL